MRLLQLTFSVILSIILGSCLNDISSGLKNSDITAPVFEKPESSSTRELKLLFSEASTIRPETLFITPEIGIEEIRQEENSVIIIFSADQQPGREYTLEALAEDKAGNSLAFITRFYGFNPGLPELLINEFTTQGTGSHPDMVEIFVSKGGDMGGICFYDGVSEDYVNKLIFPPFKVNSGDYILIHCRPQGLAEEIDETADKTLSGGYDASPDAWDFWLKDGSGLSANNGALSIYTNPDGKIMDAVLYSNRTAEADENYSGFGSSSTLKKAQILKENAAWIFSEDILRPEAAVSPEGSTSTRSICRSGTSADTDLNTDWHIVPTGKYTFGKANSDEVYIKN